MQGLRECLAGGQFVLTAELEPPKGASLEQVLRYASSLQNRVHAVNITDSPMANMRMSPIAVAHIVRRDAELDAIFHLTCRDRNVIGLQSELLGAAALGVRTILALTGDPPTHGDHPNARGVFEVDSIGLVRIAQQLNTGHDLYGNALRGVPEFLIGVAANPTAADLEAEVWKVQQKIAAGAHFIQTQPVYELEKLACFLERLKPYRVPVIAGILPLKSHKMTKHIMNNIPGIQIPHWLERRIEAGGRVAGVQAAQELLRALPAMVQGAHVMPVGSASILLQVIEGHELKWPDSASTS